MANTIKLGNGNWATKEGSLLAYNDENNNFKPLPFTTTRASSASVVNKQGLIETVGSGIPRIDFSDDANGALLLEPQRTNLIDESNNLTISWGDYNFGGGNMTEQFGVLSPDGSNNATRLTYTNTSPGSGGALLTRNLTLVANAQYTISFYAKNVSGIKQIRVDLRNSSSGGVSGSSFTLTNQWKRYTKTVTNNSETNRGLQFRLNDSEYSGDRTFDVWGIQLEQATYASSVIQTSGTAITRVADTASGSGNSTVINSSEGVLYANLSNIKSQNFDSIVINNGIVDENNTVRIWFYNNTITYQYKVGSATSAQIASGTIDLTSDTKIACSWKLNEFKLFVNGLQRGVTDTSGSVLANGTLESVQFKRGNNTGNFYGKTKDLKLYNTALTDAELTTLTTL